MIKAVSKGIYWVSEETFPDVLKSLQEYGLRETQSWFLTKEGEGNIIITPNQSSKKIEFTITTFSQELWNKYYYLFQDDIEYAVSKLIEKGFTTRFHLSLTGKKVAIHIDTSEIMGKTIYRLYVKGFKHREIREVLNRIGLGLT